MEELELASILHNIICVSLHGNAVFFLLVHQLFATEKNTEQQILRESVSEEVEEACGTSNLEVYATEQAISFYNTVGVWADVFTIGTVLETRVDLLKIQKLTVILVMP